MSDDRFDLSALDVSRDPERIDRMVGNIMWRARTELARRASAHPVSAVEVVAGWFRPALAAAAAIAAVSLTLLATAGRSRAEVQSTAFISSAEVPAAMTVWYEEDRLPTAAELLVATSQEESNGTLR